MLNSCTGSNVAVKLADSFDTPLEKQSLKNLDDQKVNEPLVVEKEPNDSKGFTKVKSPSNTVFLNKNKEKTNSEKLTNPLNKPKNKATQFRPQPYRIIIRLSGANPSAPAETVTRALREAGILFEVEKIERFDKKSSFIRKVIEDKES